MRIKNEWSARMPFPDGHSIKLTFSKALFTVRIDNSKGGKRDFVVNAGKEYIIEADNIRHIDSAFISFKAHNPGDEITIDWSVI